MPTSDSLRIGVIGLGYVGLPLSVYLARKFPTIGFDIDARRICSALEDEALALGLSTRLNDMKAGMQFSSQERTNWAHMLSKLLVQLPELCLIFGALENTARGQPMCDGITRATHLTNWRPGAVLREALRRLASCCL